MPTATAREVQWTAEILFDVIFVAGGMQAEHFADSEDPPSRERFPTQSTDDQARRIIHGGSSSKEPSASERYARIASDLSVASAVGAAASSLYWDTLPGKAGRHMTLVHAFAMRELIVKNLKHSVRRYRPRRHYRDDVENSRDQFASFPSGHASAAFVGATSMSLLYPELPTSVQVSLYGIATSAALLRVAAEKHFFTDVVVGSALGVACAYMAYYSFEEPITGASLSAGPDRILATWKF